MYRVTKLSLAVLLAASVAAAAYAANTAHDDAQAVLKAKITLTQAVDTAEQAAKGKAIRAEYEHTQSGGAYQVEVVSAGKVLNIVVDGDKGRVLSSREDKEDHGTDHDQQG